MSYRKTLDILRKSHEDKKHSVHDRKPHFIFSAENPMHHSKYNMGHDETLAFLRKKGYEVEEMMGKYGDHEKSILVHNPPKHAIAPLQKLAHDLGQDSSIMSDGYNHELHYHHGDEKGTHIKGQGTDFHKIEPNDNYSTLSDGSHFSHNLKWGESHHDNESLWKNQLHKPHVLEDKHSKDLKLIHYSPMKGMKQLDPSKQGTRIKDAGSKQGTPSHPTSFFYIEGTKPESLVTSGATSKYVTSVGNNKLYDRGLDPDGIGKAVYAEVKQAADLRQTNKGIVNNEEYNHAFHGRLKDMGYHGVYNSRMDDTMRNVVGMFGQTDLHTEHRMHPNDHHEASSIDHHEAAAPLDMTSASGVMSKAEESLAPPQAPMAPQKPEAPKPMAQPAAPKPAGVKINPDHGRAIADAYHDMKHDPNHPDVKASYSALIDETKNQFNEMMKGGLKISEIGADDRNPYPSSKHMHDDIKTNNHLHFYPTDQGFGSGDSPFGDHPMLQGTGIKHNGKELLANDLFRIVHDYNGHHLGGETGFGPKGEQKAFLEHRKMYSPLAGKALASETMGQNNWVNWSKDFGEHNRKNPAQTKYADQKAGLLPDHIINGDWHNEA